LPLSTSHALYEEGSLRFLIHLFSYSPPYQSPPPIYGIWFNVIELSKFGEYFRYSL